MIIQRWADAEPQPRTAVDLVDYVRQHFVAPDERVLRAIYESASELIANVRDHAYPPGYTAPTRTKCEIVLSSNETDKLSITVVDHGITIPQSILNRLQNRCPPDRSHAESDSAMIGIAISGSQNSETPERGKGLAMLLELVDRQIFDSLQIRSRHGSFLHRVGTHAVSQDVRSAESGTVVEITLGLRSSKPSRNSDIQISVSQFTQWPSGRYASDGPHSGEAFRTDVLDPALNEHASVTVILDGVYGYPSSFIDEAFGGLVRRGHSVAELEEKLRFVSSSDVHLIHRVWKYIRAAGTTNG